MRGNRITNFRQGWALRAALDAALLFCVWLVLSGHYDVFHLLLGGVSVGVVLVINRRDLRMASDSGRHAAVHIGRWLLYMVWLLKEMILSAFLVVRWVLSPRMPIRPHLIRFQSEQPNDLAKVILGNSITLTPGTLTVDIDGNQFLVHALSDATADGLTKGAMQTRVARLFVDQPRRMVSEVEWDQLRPFSKD